MLRRLALLVGLPPLSVPNFHLCSQHYCMAVPPAVEALAEQHLLPRITAADQPGALWF